MRPFRAGVISPSIWYGHGAILDFIREARAPNGRIYVDVGTAEGLGTLRDVRRLGRLLVRKGFRRQGSERQLRYVEAQGGRHSEADWAARLHDALHFLID